MYKRQALTLEPVKQAHISAFAPFFKDEDALYYYLPSTLRQYDAHQLETLFKEWDNGETDVLLTIRRNDAVIGLMSVDNIDLANRNAEVGIAPVSYTHLIMDSRRQANLNSSSYEVRIEMLF